MVSCKSLSRYRIVLESSNIESLRSLALFGRDVFRLHMANMVCIVLYVVRMMYIPIFNNCKWTVCRYSFANSQSFVSSFFLPIVYFQMEIASKKFHYRGPSSSRHRYTHWPRKESNNQLFYVNQLWSKSCKLSQMDWISYLMKGCWTQDFWLRRNISHLIKCF